MSPPNAPATTADPSANSSQRSARLGWSVLAKPSAAKPEVRAVNTVTDTMATVFGEQIRSLVAAGRAFTPEVTGDVVAWLVSHPEADAYAGKLLSTPTFFRDNAIPAPR